MGVSKGEQGERERDDKIEEKRGEERKWKIGWEATECEGEGKVDRRAGERR